MQLPFQAESQVQLEWRILGNLHTATEGIDRAFFRQVDGDRLRGWIGTALMLDQTARNLLEDGVILGGVTPQQLAELLGTEIQLILLENRIFGRSFTQLFVIDESRVTSVVVEVKTLTASIEADNRLLRLQVFQLHTSIFIRRGVKGVSVGNAIEGPPCFGLLSRLQKLIGMLQELGSLLRLDSPFTAYHRQIGIAIIGALIGLPYQFKMAIMVRQLEAQDECAFVRVFATVA